MCKQGTGSRAFVETAWPGVVSGIIASSSVSQHAPSPVTSVLHHALLCAVSLGKGVGWVDTVMASGQDVLSSGECEASWFGVSHCGMVRPVL